MVVLSATGVTHFVVSFAIWCYMLYVAIKVGRPDYAYLFTHGTPCFLLLATFSAALVLAMRDRRISSIVFVVALMVAGCSFCYDARHHRYQLKAFDPADGPLHGSGCTHFYATWWWYDDINNPHR
jgi:hypothetical protein